MKQLIKPLLAAAMAIGSADAWGIELLIRAKPQTVSALSTIHTYGATSRSLPAGIHKLTFQSQADLERYLADHRHQLEHAEQVEDVRIPQPINLHRDDPGSIQGQGMFDRQWGMESSTDNDVNILQAWNHSEGSDDIIVAVIDTGVDYNHPDLASAMWKNRAEIPGNGKDDDGNGFVDDYHGWDFANNDNSPMDGGGHGTHCAGVIAGQGDRAWGVAPRVKIMPLKFLKDGGSGSTADAIEAIYYAIDMGAQVLSNSWGGGGHSPLLREAIEVAHSRGIIFVAAAGNNGRNLDTAPSYPASYTVPNVISVAAISENGKRAWFSNYSSSLAFIAAPGVDIYSTYPNGDYVYLSGTSMAAPFVSGIVALMLSMDSDLSTGRVKSVLLQTAKYRDSLVGVAKVAGITDAGAALTLLAGGGDGGSGDGSGDGDDDGGGDDGDDGDDDEIGFDPDAVDVERRSSRKWYQYYDRLVISLSMPSDMLDSVDSVSYRYLKKHSYKMKESSDRDGGFEKTLKTRHPEQELVITITLDNGASYVIVD